jgi:hypothetical protein
MRFFELKLSESQFVNIHNNDTLRVFIVMTRSLFIAMTYVIHKNDSIKMEQKSGLATFLFHLIHSFLFHILEYSFPMLLLFFLNMVQDASYLGISKFKYRCVICTGYILFSH